MKKSILLASAALELWGCAGLNVKKTCYANGVCRVERNGQVSWEGPPDKVAEMQGKEQQKQAKLAELDKAFDEAPKRPATEPIRIALVGPTTGFAELAPFAPRYRQMLEAALRQDPRLQLVPYEQVKMLVEAKSEGDAPSFGAQQASRAAVDEPLTRRLRNFNSPVDVVMVVQLTPKKNSGLVSGGGGIGVADVVNVQFDASLSSVYHFQKLEGSQVGKSTDSIKLAGFDKNGKKGSGELKGKRNPENDGPAISALGTWASGAIEQQVAPTLPSMAALDELHKKNRSAASQGAPAWMQGLLKGKK